MLLCETVKQYKGRSGTRGLLSKFCNLNGSGLPEADVHLSNENS